MEQKRPKNSTKKIIFRCKTFEEMQFLIYNLSENNDNKICKATFRKNDINKYIIGFVSMYVYSFISIFQVLIIWTQMLSLLSIFYVFYVLHVHIQRLSLFENNCLTAIVGEKYSRQNQNGRQADLKLNVKTDVITLISGSFDTCNQKRRTKLWEQVLQRHVPRQKTT